MPQICISISKSTSPTIATIPAAPSLERSLWILTPSRRATDRRKVQTGTVFLFQYVLPLDMTLETVDPYEPQLLQLPSRASSSQADLMKHPLICSSLRNDAVQRGHHYTHHIMCWASFVLYVAPTRTGGSVARTLTIDCLAVMSHEARKHNANRPLCPCIISLQVHGAMTRFRYTDYSIYQGFGSELTCFLDRCDIHPSATS